jgi:hypothetical protein
VSSRGFRHHDPRRLVGLIHRRNAALADQGVDQRGLHVRLLGLDEHRYRTTHRAPPSIEALCLDIQA